MAVVPMLFALLPLPPRPPSVAEKPPCVVAREWVRAHPHSIPADINSFALFPKVYRRAAYNEMTVDERVRLWREHLALYSGAASRLSSDQKKFINDVSRALPDIFSRRNSKESLDAFGQHAIAVLGKHVAVIVFGNLAIVDPTLLNLAAMTRVRIPTTVIRLAASIPQQDRQLKAQFASLESDTEAIGATLAYAYSNLEGIRKYTALSTCTCHSGNLVDFCNDITGPESHCYATFACEPQDFGCGWFWLEHCDGLCS